MQLDANTETSFAQYLVEKFITGKLARHNGRQAKVTKAEINHAKNLVLVELHYMDFVEIKRV